MFTPVKGPLWAQAYQKNIKAYADLGQDIFSGLHANFGQLMPDVNHGPYVSQRHIGPINSPYKNDDNLARPNFRPVKGSCIRSAHLRLVRISACERSAS